MSVSAPYGAAAYQYYFSEYKPLVPPCRDGLLGDGLSLSWRQRSGASMAALRHAELRQSYGCPITGIRHLDRGGCLAGGFLNDLPRQLIGVSGPLFGHGAIVVH